MPEVVTRDGKAFLRDRISGNLFTVDAGKAQDLIARGEYDAATQEQVDRRTAERESSVLGAGARGLAAGVAGGVLSVPKIATAAGTAGLRALGADVKDPFADLSGRQFVEDIGALTMGDDVVQGSNLARQQIEQDIQAHPIAFGAGELAGQVAGGAMYGGVAGRAAQAAGLGRRGVQIAQGLTEGAALGGEMVSEDAWIRDQVATAEQTLAGVGLGAMFGGGAAAAFAYAPSVLRRIYGKADDAVAPAIADDAARASGLGDDLERTVLRAERAGERIDDAAARAEATAAKGAAQQAPLRVLRGGTEAADEVPGLIEQKATKTLKQRASEWLSGLSDESAVQAIARQNKPALRALGGRLGPDEQLTGTAGRVLKDTGIVRMGASEEQMYERAAQVAAASGDDVGKVLRRVDEALPTVDATSFSTRLDEQLEGLRVGLTPTTQRIARKIERETQIVRDAAEAGELFPSQLHAFRREIDKQIKYASATQNPVQDALKGLRRIAEEQLESEIERAGKLPSVNRALLDEYKTAKQTYRVSAWAEETLAERVNLRNNANRYLSITDQGVAAAGFIGAGGGLPGIAFAAGGAAANKLFRERGLGSMSALAQQLSKRLAQESVDVARAPAYAQPAARAIQAMAAASDERAAKGIGAFMARHYGGTAPRMPRAVRSSRSALLARMASDSRADRRAAYRQHAEEVIRVASNPEIASQRLADITGTTIPSAAPKLNAQMAAVAARGAQYLAMHAPAPPHDPRSILPQLSDPPPVSDDQLDIYARRVEGVEDPDSLYDDLARNVVYPEKVDAVKTVWPLRFDAIRAKVFADLVSRNEPVPYEARATLDVLLDAGGALEPSQSQEFQALMTGAFEAQMQTSKPKKTSGGAGASPVATAMMPRSESIAMGVR